SDPCGSAQGHRRLRFSSPLNNVKEQTSHWRRRRTPVSPNRSLKAAQVLEDLQVGATAVPPSMKLF
ncbi:hypothetical protein, partial [Microvirga terrestris]|uniref:hypothetical protein n=1 Tax=Microvirga terrestris TaxID=2791024 RepID=UPI001AED52A6